METGRAVPSSTRDTRRKRRGARGEVLVEFEFASIVFLMILFGTVSYGMAVWKYNTVSYLAQEGARWASVHSWGSPLAVAEGFTSSTASTQTSNFVHNRAPGVNGTTVTITWFTRDGCSGSGDHDEDDEDHHSGGCSGGDGEHDEDDEEHGGGGGSGSSSNNIVGNIVQVHVEMYFKPFTTLIPNAQLKLQSTSQMVIAR